MQWVACLLLSAFASGTLIEPLRHDVKILTPKNFDGTINKQRDRFPGAVLFYKNNKAAKNFINKEWDSVAKSLKGMANVGGLDCGEYKSFCDSADIKLESNDYHIRMYPQLPLPPKDYAGQMTSQKIIARITKMIPVAQLEVLKDENDMSKFVGDFPSIPKVILFTDKPKAAPMFNALVHSFADRMHFGIVSGPADGPLATRFRVKQVPAVILKKGDLSLSLKGAQTYRGEMKFLDIFNWLNVHSETFVKNGGFLSDKEPTPENLTETRPWLTQRIPEMMKGSHNDICFKKSRGLCAVYLKDGELDDTEKSMLEQLSDDFGPNRKIGFHWSWMNVSKEPNFAKLFKLISPEDSSTLTGLPSLVVINPHKRLRFSKLSGDETVTKDTLAKFLEKIESGDGRFTVIKGNKVPAFEKRVAKSDPAPGDGAASTPPPNEANEKKEEL